MSTDLTITLFSHHFEAAKLSPRGRAACISFYQPLIDYKFRRPNRWGYLPPKEPEKIYATADAARQYYRFHINMLQDFKQHLFMKAIPEDAVTWNVEALYEPAKSTVSLKPEYKPYDSQVPFIEYLVNAPYKTRQLGLQMGEGKGMCAISAMCQLGVRTVFMWQPKYVTKWINELKEKCAFNHKNDLMVVLETKQLKSLLILAKEGQLKASMIIITMDIMYRWIKAYEHMGDLIFDEGYVCRPQEFFEVIQAGLQVCDEFHSFFHRLFKIRLYTHLPISFDMSGTVVSEKKLIKQMHEVMWPYAERAPGAEIKKHSNAVNVYYHFKNPDLIRTSEKGGTTYAHTALEKSIMKHAPTLLNYFRLIDLIIQEYLLHPRSKKRMAVYAATTEMCTKLRDWFKKKYPHLDIRRYCGSIGDPYEDVIEPDIRFSTLGSSGTAIDIPDLVSTLLTVGLSSVQANLQVFGRNRALKETSPGAGDNETTFYFLTASNITKQMNYAEEKRNMFRLRAKSYREMHSGIEV